MPPSARCEYFERYGDYGRQPQGLCENASTLALADSQVRPAILVCDEHAGVIVSRYPELGSIADRFVSVDQLDEFGRVPRTSQPPASPPEP